MKNKDNKSLFQSVREEWVFVVICKIESNCLYREQLDISYDNVLCYIPEDLYSYDALIIMIGLLLPWNYCFSYDGIYDTMLFTQDSHLKVLPMPFIITHKKLICVQNHLLSPSRLYLRLLKVNVQHPHFYWFLG